jgi:DNA-binding CsgD family transcriptional regulator
MLLYVFCCIADAATILISRLLYRKFGHKAFKYLSILMTGAFLLMLVEAVRTYGSIANADTSIITRVIYLVFVPSGEVIQFLIFPIVAFAAVGKKVPDRLSLISKIYALAVVATFPVEFITGSPEIKMIRELAGQFVFHIYAYIVIFINYRKIINNNLKKALESYLILGAVIVPVGIIFQSGHVAGFLHIYNPEIPYPYIIYCLLFNILCIVNASRYLFVPLDREERDIPEQFFLQHHITDREKEIIELLLKGYSNQQIGKALFISTRTVKNHIYSIYRKTNIQNRMQLVNRINLYHSIPVNQ